MEAFLNEILNKVDKYNWIGGDDPNDFYLGDQPGVSVHFHKTDSYGGWTPWKTVGEDEAHKLSQTGPYSDHVKEGKLINEIQKAVSENLNERKKLEPDFTYANEDELIKNSTELINRHFMK